jgi:hypothetical protein
LAGHLVTGHRATAAGVSARARDGRAHWAANVATSGSLQDEADNRRGLPDQQHREGDDEAHHKGGCGYHHDQVNGPRVIASTNKVEVTGPAFISKYVKAHGGLHQHRVAYLEEIPGRPRQCPPSPVQDITFSSRRGRHRRMRRKAPAPPCARALGRLGRLAVAVHGVGERRGAPPATIPATMVSTSTTTAAMTTNVNSTTLTPVTSAAVTLMVGRGAGDVLKHRHRGCLKHL